VQSTRAYLIVIVLLLSVGVGLQVWRDRGWQPYEPTTPILWLQDAATVRRLALGFDNLIADVYWMRAVVYFGRQRLSERQDKNYDLLYPFLDFVTALDPRFTTAYRFGAIFLSEPPPGGPARPDLAIELLKRGAERTPNRWEYLHDVGFVYFWTMRDYTEAAQWYQRASKIDGAPFWLNTTAAALLAQGGERRAARLIWQQMLESADDDWLKQESRTRLLQFDALDAIDQLNQVLWTFKLKMGYFPRDWEEVVNARMLRGVPTDPAGTPFELDAENEIATVSPSSPLSPMPADFSPSEP
jgi:tetratricopeptide (TPR) repeat protein